MKVDKKDFIFLPLGGSSEIGMNANLYHYKGGWILVDLGVSFADETMPGVDIILPDIEYIKNNIDNLLGIFLTHGHEDHMGAVQYLWNELKAPIFGSAFTISLLKKKLKESGILSQVTLKTIKHNEKVSMSPFEITPIKLTHSIPDPFSFIISTIEGDVFHSGDWKFDTDPQIGEKVNVNDLKRIGEKGLLALVGDSTNAMINGKTESEKVAFDGIKDQIMKAKGRVFITCFSSNLARIKSIIMSAKECNKKVSLVGRSIQRVVDVGFELGYLDGLPEIYSLKDIQKYNHMDSVIIVAGSQGEVRSSLTRIANGDHGQIRVKPKDTVIFSSSKIPGNELAIERVQDSFLRKDVKVITDEDAKVHVSGHPSIEDLKSMYNFLKPQISVPVHGTSRHISSHSKLAKSFGVSVNVVPENGSVVKLSGNAPGIIGQIKTSALIPDGNQIVNSDSNIFSLRKKMLWNGHVSSVIIFDNNCDLNLPIRLTQKGLLENGQEIDWFNEVEEEIIENIESLSINQRKEDFKVEETVISSIRTVTKVLLDRRPVINVHIIRNNR